MDYLVLFFLIGACFAWAGSAICGRKGFRFGPWLLPCFMGLGVIGILSIAALYMLPSAEAAGIDTTESLRRRQTSRRVGLTLTWISVAIFVVIIVLAMIQLLAKGIVNFTGV